MLPPVFIVGSPRSGTTYLYHLLLSSGGFAVYRAETRAYDLIRPRFGDLRSRRSRRAFLSKWTQGFLFERSGLDADDVRARVLSECRGTGDFLRILMGGIADSQGVRRWAECTPTHALYLDSIRRDFPDAWVIHMIRDGRDVAISMAKQGWVAPLPGDGVHRAVPAGLYWSWIVGHARRHRRRSGNRYLEVRFEELVENPGPVLEELGSRIGHELDYEAILRNPIGSVRRPNTSFSGGRDFSPVGRWRSLGSERRKELEGHISLRLGQLGYELGESGRPLPARLRRAAYFTAFEGKRSLRDGPLGRALIDDTELAAKEPVQMSETGA